MTDLNDLLCYLDSKYLLSLDDKIKAIENGPTLKIGFIGEFSSGKSSLINSVLGTKLPVDIMPTTKAICIIEAVNGISEYRYFKEVNYVRLPISWEEFDCILNGEKSEAAVAVIQIPPTEVLAAGYVFVDTPGIASINANNNEADLTYDYLAELDAAVVCLRIDDGTLKSSLRDFICRPELKLIQHRMFFALTHSDLKPKDAELEVKKQIVTDLIKLKSYNKFDIYNPEKKVLTISSKDANNDEKLLSFLRGGIYGNSAISTERKLKNYLALAANAQTQLELLEDTINYEEDNSLEDRIKEIKESIEELEANKSKVESDINSRLSTIKSEIKNCISNYKDSIVNASSEEERENEVRSLNESIASHINEQYSQIFSVKSTDRLIGNICKGFNGIEQIHTLIVDFLPVDACVEKLKEKQKSLFAEWLLGPDDVSFGKKALITTLANHGRRIADVTVGFVTSSIKGEIFDEQTEALSTKMAHKFTSLIKREFDTKVIKHIKEDLEEQQRSLTSLYEERKNDFEGYLEKKNGISKDIENLKAQIHSLKPNNS